MQTVRQFWRMALKPSPSLTSTPALAPGAGTSLGSLASWSGCELVRVRGCELTSGMRVDSGASWCWGGLTRKLCNVLICLLGEEASIA